MGRSSPGAKSKGKGKDKDKSKGRGTVWCGLAHAGIPGGSSARFAPRFARLACTGPAPTSPRPKDCAQAYRSSHRIRDRVSVSSGHRPMIRESWTVVARCPEMFWTLRIRNVYAGLDTNT